MSEKTPNDDSRAAALQNESARQRWQLFHRAIAHAKRSNLDTFPETDVAANDDDQSRPVLTVVR